MENALAAAEETLAKYQGLAQQAEPDEAALKALNQSATAAAKTLTDAVKNLVPQSSGHSDGGGGGGTVTPTSYVITKAAVENGTFTTSADKTKSGDKVTITVKESSLNWSYGLPDRRLVEALRGWTVDELPGNLFRMQNADGDDLLLILRPLAPRGFSFSNWKSQEVP